MNKSKRSTDRLSTEKWKDPAGPALWLGDGIDIGVGDGSMEVVGALLLLLRSMIEWEDFRLELDLLYAGRSELHLCVPAIKQMSTVMKSELIKTRYR